LTRRRLWPARGRDHLSRARAHDQRRSRRRLTRDDVLDDFTLYWLTNTAISAARYYWESHINLYNAADVSIPAAVSVFPGENYQAPRSWAERAYHKLIYYNKVDQAGHYAAWEQPQLFSAEVRAAFRPLRRSIWTRNGGQYLSAAHV
jgi:pimeloyl-ACP methyl ester carboxylesterase